MPALNLLRSPVYHHFILLVWEERDMEGRHVTWRFSLQDSHKEVRIGFKSLEDLGDFLKNCLEGLASDQTK